MAIDNQPTGTRETAADRRVKALDLRKSGAPYRAIAAQLNISEKTAHQDVQRALRTLAELELASADELRTMELLRLDKLTLEAARILSATHPYVAGGRVLHGLTDDGPKLQAIDRLLRISESRRKLLGLDAPQAIDVQGGMGQQQIIGVVLHLLEPYPELKLLLAEQLDQVIDASDDTNDAA